MANTFSSLKRVRIEAGRTVVNQMRKSRLRHQIRGMRRALDHSEKTKDVNDAKAAHALLPQTFSLVDRAAKWGIIKKNTAARYKSRMSVRLKALAGAAA